MKPFLLAAVILGGVFDAGCGSKCDSSNCTGCCSADGVCQQSNAQTCGLGGGACAQCVGAQSCVNGACESIGHTTGNTTAGTNATTSATTSASGSNGASTVGGSGSAGSHGSSSGGSSSTTVAASSSGTSSSSAATTGTVGGSSSSGAASTGTIGSSTGTTTAAASSSSSTTGTSSTSTGSSTGTTSTSTSTTSTGTSTTTTSTSTSTTGTSGGVCSGFVALNLHGPGTSTDAFGNTQGDATYASSCTDPFLGTPVTSASQGYSFTLSSPAILNASVSSLDGGSVILSLTEGCGTSETDDGCASDELIGTASFSPTRLNAGTYNLRVGANSATFLGGSDFTGEYDLAVSLGAPVANDDCSGVVFLSPVNGQASVTVDTTNATNDSVTSPSGQCTQDDGSGTGTVVGFGNGPDVVYGLTLNNPVAGGIRATLTPVNGSTASPVLSIRSGPQCINNFSDAGATTVSELGCFITTDGGAASVVTGAVSAGTYYLWVDSYSGTMGQMRLDVDVR